MDIFGQAEGELREDGESELYVATESLHMTEMNERMPRISLKQWRLFLAVIDNDGFVGAAKKMHISQSSISHALAKLQDQLGVPLLTLKGRKTHITEHGKTLLTHSRDLLRQASQLEQLGELLRPGAAPHIRLVIEPSYPAEVLIQTFNDLSSELGMVGLNIKETDFADIRRLMHQGKADLAISTAILSGFASNKLTELEHIAIAPTDSPLLSADKAVTDEDLARCFQIMLCAGSSNAEPFGMGRSADGLPVWRVSSLSSVAHALRFGMGYAWLPRHRVQGWLDDGWVGILPLERGASYTMPIYLTRGRVVAPGSSAQRFADALHAVTAKHAARPGVTPVHGATSLA